MNFSTQPIQLCWNSTCKPYINSRITVPIFSNLTKIQRKPLTLYGPHYWVNLHHSCNTIAKDHSLPSTTQNVICWQHSKQDESICSNVQWLAIFNQMVFIFSWTYCDYFLTSRWTIDLVTQMRSCFQESRKRNSKYYLEARRILCFVKGHQLLSSSCVCNCYSLFITVLLRVKLNHIGIKLLWHQTQNSAIRKRETVLQWRAWRLYS